MDSPPFIAIGRCPSMRKRPAWLGVTLLLRNFS
jgi:hypothetical protein